MTFRLIELTGISPCLDSIKAAGLLTCHVNDPAFRADRDLTSRLTVHIPKFGTIGVNLRSYTTGFSYNDTDEFHRVEGSSAHLATSPHT